MQFEHASSDSSDECSGACMCVRLLMHLNAYKCVCLSICVMCVSICVMCVCWFVTLHICISALYMIVSPDMFMYARMCAYVCVCA